MAKKLSPLPAEEVLWKDRRRYLGLPISFTRYEVTAERFVLRKGLFTTKTDEILVYRITDIQLVQTLGQKIFGVGTVTLLSADKSHPIIEIKSVKRPDELRRYLGILIEEQRSPRGISSREFFDAGDDLDGLE